MMQTTSSNWTLGRLLDVVGEPSLASDPVVHGLSMDSRVVQAGDVFLACQGASGHGLDYLDEVTEAGAVAVIYEPTKTAPEANIPVVAVSGLGEKAGLLADRFYQEPSAEMSVVAVTGTNGKTSVSHYVAQALHQLDGQCGLLGTLGYGLYGQMEKASHTTPDVIKVHQMMSTFVDMDCDYAVMEVSSHALDQGRVDAMHFAIAVFTNLSRDHLDYHGDMSAYSAAKRRLFDWPGLQAAVINADDPVGAEWLKSLPDSVARMAFSLSAPAENTPTVWASDIQYSLSGMQMKLVTPSGEAQLNVGLLGRFNAENLLASLAVLLQLGISLDQVVSCLESVEAVAGRMQRVGSENTALSVVDYAHTPDALEQVLKAIRMHISGSLICVFGCGGDRDQGKRSEMGSVAEENADHVIVTDDNPRSENPAVITDQILTGFSKPETVSVIHDREQAIQKALSLAGDNDAVLVAGKGHETLQIIGDRSLPFDDAAVINDWLEIQR